MTGMIGRFTVNNCYQFFTPLSFSWCSCSSTKSPSRSGRIQIQVWVRDTCFLLGKARCRYVPSVHSTCLHEATRSLCV